MNAFAYQVLRVKLFEQIRRLLDVTLLTRSSDLLMQCDETFAERLVKKAFGTLYADARERLVRKHLQPGRCGPVSSTNSASDAGKRSWWQA